MELTLNRYIKNKISTIGTLSIDSKEFCKTLEDTDRDLKQSDTLAYIQSIKVPGKTAIPRGRYEVIITLSNRFKIDLPLLVNVPGYEGIRIHPGNTAVDTDGCILPGTYYDENTVANSRDTFNKLFLILKDALTKEKVWINIT